MFRFYICTMEISFGANYKKLTTVKKLVDNKYIQTPVTIAQANISDLKTFSKITKMWHRPYAEQIEQAVALTQWNFKKDVYILTEQSENLEELIPNKILGMVYLDKGEERNLLAYIQVNPDFELKNYTTAKRIKNFISKILNKPNSSDRKYKGVGTALVRYLQEIYNDKKMELAAVGTSKTFYKKFGFKNNPFPKDYLMSWTPVKKTS